MSVGGIEDLSALAAKLEAVAKLGEHGAKKAAEAIGKAAAQQYATQTSPDGDRWSARKMDGAPALQRAPTRVRFYASGNAIYEAAPDHYKYHRRGTKYLAVRSVFAAGGHLPPVWQAAAQEAFNRELASRLR